MAKKNKLWFSGEDAQLAARFTKFMTKVLYARRASYIRALIRLFRRFMMTAFLRICSPMVTNRR